MTTRTDVDYDIARSPRIATVAAPSIEMVMQDYVDTTRPFESSFNAMSQPFLMSASGKEDLGGGTLVAITVNEEDLKLAFQARTTTAQTGTVTTGSGAPDINNEYLLIDTAALFITNGITRGSLIINYTDQSVADVVEITSETQLTCVALVNGIGNEFDISDVYDIYNIIQVRTTGGNLVANDANDVTFPAILPTAFTQVIQTSSSSGTIQESEDIQYASFNGRVTVDLISGTAGTIFPTGTERQPVSNFADALSIASSRGFLTLSVLGDALIDSGLDFTNYTIIGQGQNLTTFTLAAAATFVNSSFESATVSGTLDGDSRIEDCIIQGLTFVSGVISNCLLDSGTIILGGSQTAHFVNCASGVAGTGTPEIDMGGSGQALALRNYNGGIRLSNKSGSESVSIDLNAGQVILDADVTAGTIVIRGVGGLTDNSVGATVLSDELINTVSIGDAVWDTLIADHSVVGSFGEFVVRRLLTVAKFFSLRV